MSTVDLSRDGDIATLTLNNPGKLNAIDLGMWQQLAKNMAELAVDRNVRCIVLRGAGNEAFAAGGDLEEFLSKRATLDQALHYHAQVAAALDAIADSPLPTVALIQGACIGGGLEIAGCCDIRICDTGARFGLPIAKTLGNILNMNNFARFYALVGPAAIAEMIMTSRLFSSAEAKHIGLVSEVLDTPDAVAARAMELATSMSTLAPLTLKATKIALRRLRHAAGEVEGDDLVTMCFTSADFQEGVDAFLNKRAPKFQGK